MAFLMEFAVGLVPVRAAPVGTTEVSLHDDDGGAALFDTGQLHPGRSDMACVALSVRGSADTSGEVRLNAEVGEDDLAPFLRVTVERGTVGGSRTCASFTGEALWSGTLAEFPRTAASGILTGWRPGLVDRAVYRFTVTVVDDSRAQDREAAATFVWSLDQAEPAPKPDPEPEPQPEPVPRVAGSPMSAETPAPPSPTEPPGATPLPPEVPPAGEPPPGADDVVEASPLPVGPSSIPEVIEHVAETAISVARDGHFPAVLLVVLVAFLALQGAADRRDPKLALARLHPELREFRPFPESSRTDIP